MSGLFGLESELFALFHGSCRMWIEDSVNFARSSYGRPRFSLLDELIKVANKATPNLLMNSLGR